MYVRFFKAAAAALFSVVFFPSHAAACSVCRCGDPTFNALGTNIFTRGQFHLALDYDRLEKEQGAAHGDAHQGSLETLTETRLVVTASYGFTERLQAVVSLPWSRRQLGSAEGAADTSGLGDPEIYGIYRLWSSSWEGAMGRRTWISLVAGVKTPWGENAIAKGGERLDEHVQPGTGSTDLFGGLSGVHLVSERSTLYASVLYRGTDRNDFGYLYGNTVLANLGYERKLSARWDAALEANGRDAGRDEIDALGAEDLNTGGAILFLSPRLLVDLGKSVVARLALQIPVYDGLNGEQREKTVLNLGVTATF